ncbi:hypothetical protein [Bradyrhizobium sp.]|uniref:hypothetical protein n=1 Tax=Bradyrhizobium sp. TaxID=376 RepID=UPI003C13B588
MVVVLAGCGERTESYRYKLTVAVNTPDGVKRASSVVEVLFGEISIPGRGILHKLRGEALYLDLGSGAKPLIALLTRQLHVQHGRGREPLWSRDGGPGPKLYGLALSGDTMADVSRLARMRGLHRITPADLPDLVTFADVNDPKTVIEVDRSDLQATLGPDISWNEITLESTDEPITAGIVRKLPWLSAYYVGMLDGSRYHDRGTLANTLSAADFDHSGDLKESK